MNIVTTGYYGYANFGDDLFIISLDIAAKSYWSDHEIFFISPQIKGVRPEKFIVPGWVPAERYSAGGLYGKYIRWYYLLRGMIKADIILNAGGSTISSISSIRRLEFLVRFKSILGYSVDGIGISVGPFGSNKLRRRAKNALLGFQHISVRDKDSYRQLSGVAENKKVLAADMVGLIAQANQFHDIPKDRDVIGLCVMDLSNVSDTDTFADNFDKLVGEVLDYAKKYQKTIRLFALNTHKVNGDMDAVCKLRKLIVAKEVKYELVIHDRNALFIWNKIAGCSFMISSRLHGAIAAYLSDVPFLLMEYHKKCRDFLDDISYPEAQRINNLVENKSIRKFLRSPVRPAIRYPVYIQHSIKNFERYYIS